MSKQKWRVVNAKAKWQRKYFVPDPDYPRYILFEESEAPGYIEAELWDGDDDLLLDSCSLPIDILFDVVEALKTSGL